jgi:hypothetical protein
MVDTNVLKKQAASIFFPEDRGSSYLRNVATRLPKCKGEGTSRKLATATQPQFPRKIADF